MGTPCLLARRIAILIASAGVFLFAPCVLAAPLSSVAAIALGDVHSCALRSDGSVLCWGYNGYGVLGDGSQTTRALPASVAGLSSGIAAIAAGGSHSCALTTGGAVQCWGHNNDGQVGDGTTADKYAPVEVLASGATSVTVGNEHTCALLGGAVKCWGSNFFGEIGDGTTTQRLVPTDLPGLATGVSSIAAGAYYTCALMSGGTVKCWGHDDHGQLGNGTTSTGASPNPMDVPGLSGVTAISTGFSHACAILPGGALKCWGKNDFGQLGDGTTIDRLVPTDVQGLGSGVLAVEAGNYHTCALVSGGGVKCWGGNTIGQLGDGSAMDQHTPVDVVGITSGAVAVSTGLYHSCALLADATMRCWGEGFLGQLGDGTQTTSVIPVTVGFLVPQAISFGSLAARDVNDSPFTLSATSSSGLPVTFTSQTPGVCTVAGSNATVLGIGICTIAANQAGDTTYAAASQVVQTFLIGGSAPGWAPRLANISTRVHVDSGYNVAIGGFVVSASAAAKRVIVRALGPSLAGFVSDPLANPTVSLLRISGGAPVATNDDWASSPSAATIQAIGLAPADSRESAMMVMLDPGAYTAVVSGAGGTSGVALVEVYEIDQPDRPLINISTRGSVGTASDVMIGGFVVQGTTPQTVMVRGIGPSLSAYGVAGALSNPTLQLVRMSDSSTIATNDDWGSASNVADVIASGFAPSDPHESAILITLDPGAYTAIVSGAGGATGVGMVEVYAVP